MFGASGASPEGAAGRWGPSNGSHADDEAGLDCNELAIPP